MFFWSLKKRKEITKRICPIFETSQDVLFIFLLKV